MTTRCAPGAVCAAGSYGAVFFRDQDITPAQHLALAAEFGEPEPHPIVAGIPGYPEIVRIIKEANTPTKFGETWHSDHSFMDEPCVGSILVARELPPYGNDTLWASMYAVYESLSDGMKALLNDMTAIHSAAYAFSPEGGSRKDNFDGKKEMKYQLHPILERAFAPGLGSRAPTHPVPPCSRVPYPVSLCRRRGGAPRHHHPPGDGQEGAVRQLHVHRPLQGHDREGVAAPAGVPVLRYQQARVPVPLPLGARIHCLLGQPCDTAHGGR